jgi:hypothetical protein
MTQVPYPMPAPPTPSRPRGPGPGVPVSVSLMVLGAVIGIASVIAIVIPLVGTFTSAEYPVPTVSPLHLHLRHARYTVYERSGSRSAFGIRRGVITIDSTQVSVRGPAGESVYVFPDSHTETITRGSAVYTGAVQFDVPTTGDYDVRISPRLATSVVIARSLTDAVRSVLVWVGTAVIGGILFLTGLVMLIVGATRRGRARRALQMGYGPVGWGQPGWGPPPSYGPPPSPGPSQPDDPWAPPPV